MSFILDALKKSESERQRRSGPSLATVRTGRAKGSGLPWISIVAVLLALNLVVVLGFLVWPEDDEEPASEQSVATGRAARPVSPQPALTPAPAPAPPRVLQVEPPTETLSASAGGPAPSITSSARPQIRSLAEESEKGRPSPPPVQPAVQRAPVAREESPPSPPVPAVLPTLTELTLDGRLNIPTLHVDIHVYSATPSSRFVFINNRKYKEGEQLSEGPYVEEISGEGVVLNHRGQRFLLPRD